MTRDYIAGVIVLMAAFVAIILMIAISFKVVADATIEEAQEDADRRAAVEAERRYQEYIHSTQYRVHMTVRITNESDIPW